MQVGRGTILHTCKESKCSSRKSIFSCSYSVQLIIHSVADRFIVYVEVLSFTPECEENMKTKLRMTFEELEAVEKFYK